LIIKGTCVLAPSERVSEVFTSLFQIVSNRVTGGELLDNNMRLYCIYYGHGHEGV